MLTDSHHVFLSYARKDNEPDHDGWVTAFYERLKAEHRSFDGRDLDIFFDRTSIRDMDDWRLRIRQNLRSSMVFIAFLSPNYLKSETCRWELEEYIRLEPTLVHGSDGIAQVYFVAVPELEAGTATEGAGFPPWVERLRSRHRERFDLRPWFPQGPGVLRELAVRERLEALREQADPRADLIDNIQALDQLIVERIGRVTLARSAPGNLPSFLGTWVGRTRELAALHEALTCRRIGLVTAVHGLGGLGKTALAIQYAHAFANYYASGGRWLVECETAGSLAEAFLQLSKNPRLAIEIPPEAAGDPGLALRWVLEGLKAHAVAGAKRLAEAARGAREDCTAPHVLVILDNVAQGALLSSEALSQLPAEDWLHVIATTRLDPAAFAADARTVAPLAVDHLPDAEALELIRKMQPGERIGSPEDENAAREIVHRLGGFTLAVEAVAVFLAVYGKEGMTPGKWLEGFASDCAATLLETSEDQGVAARVRHREKQLALVLEPTLQSLEPEARTALEYASLMAPDFVVAEWLFELTATRHPGLRSSRALVQPWTKVLRRLEGLRLITPAELDPETGHPRIYRVHRLVAGHVSEGLSDRAERLQKLMRLLEAAAYALNNGLRHNPSLMWMTPSLAANGVNLQEAVTAPRPLMMVLLISGSAELNHGRIALVEPLLGKATALARRAREDNRESALAARDLSMSLNKLAKFLDRRAQPGDRARAFKCLQESLALSRRLNRDNPDSAEAARDLSISLNGFADVLNQRAQPGDRARALEFLNESLALARRLHQDNPDSAEAVRDLSISLNILTDVLDRRAQPRDRVRALECVEESLALRRRLHQDNPDSAEAVRDLCVSLNRLARFLARRARPGDRARAFECLEESLALRRRLRTDNPGSAEAARGLSISLNGFADVLARRARPGDRARAFECLEESLALARRLHQDNPDSAEAASDLSVSLNRLADVLDRRAQHGDRVRALECMEESVALCRRQYGGDRKSAEASRDLEASLNRLARSLARRAQPGDIVRAFECLNESLALRLRLHEDNPGGYQSGRDLLAIFFKTACLVVRCLLQRLRRALLTAGALHD